MPTLATTQLSSKGQVVIPEQIRKKLKLKTGSKFVVVGEKGTVVLKEITPPAMAEFDSLITEARKQARTAGLKRGDITLALKKVRTKR